MESKKDNDMKKCFTFFLVLFLWSSLAFSQSIVGKWKTIDDKTGKAKSVVKIYKAKNGLYYGKIEQLLDPSRDPNVVCTKCTGANKDKPIVGLVIITKLSKNGSVWSGGKILDPENGKNYKCKLWLDKGTLKVRGYWGVFYRTQTWYKAS